MDLALYAELLNHEPRPPFFDESETSKAIRTLLDMKRIRREYPVKDVLTERLAAFYLAYMEHVQRAHRTLARTEDDDEHDLLRQLHMEAREFIQQLPPGDFARLLEMYDGLHAE